jgi:hypothetical protein
MPNAYNYSNTAVQTTLGGNISGATTSFTVAATTGFPPTVPYILALDYGAATEELVKVTAVAGTTLTGDRGFSGTSAQSHSIGAVVRHVVNAQDLTDFRTHEASTGAVHGLTGNIVGTSDTQTLSNKTLTSPTINAGALSGTFSGTPTFSGNTTFSAEVAHTNLFRGSRALATDSQMEARVTADTNARWFVRADGRMSWGPGNAAFDTSLYRGGAGILQTDHRVSSVRTNGGDLAFHTQRSADAGARWYITADGAMTWADGTGSADTNLFRAAADTLRTNDNLVVDGTLTAGVTTTTGVTPAAGWSVTAETFRATAGVKYANLTLNRTGATISNPGGASGNISPDLQLLTGVPADWRPTGAPILFMAATGLASGAGRINTDGTLDLTDWVAGQDIASGANMRLSWVLI